MNAQREARKAITTHLLHQYNTVTDCHGGGNLGPQFGTHIKVVINGRAPYDNPNMQEIQESGISRKN
jgi:hypothetical protein